MANDCWNQIGVEGRGDRTCAKLKTVTHCRNCPVYSTAGRSLLERVAPPEYIHEWTEIVAKTLPAQSIAPANGAIVQSTETISIMIFRLGGEWLALPVRLFQEVTQPCVIHTLPHRSNQLFLGLVNIRGEILMCICLGHLLDLDTNDSSPPQNSVVSKRMVVVGSAENRWVFSVDEVYGVHRFPMGELQSTPVVIAKASETYTKGVIHWQGHQVSYLDADLLFYTLNRRIL
ncbi:MAG: chemotaxis protein CheW [Nostocaceae cyanobacterium]|nr:chemotaxis protein CheW [Nostocaceae cyanobacterium]